LRQQIETRTRQLSSLKAAAVAENLSQAGGLVRIFPIERASQNAPMSRWCYRDELVPALQELLTEPNQREISRLHDRHLTQVSRQRFATKRNERMPSGTRS